MKRVLIVLLMTSALAACSHSQNTPADRSISNQTELIITDTAYFAAGCFWCVEAIFESIEGVGEVISGYSGGNVLNPTYEMVCSGKTGHAETVMILYNSKQVLYDTLLMAFFGSHNPETENQQGPDIGTQYRSIIFYNKASEKIAAENYIKELIDQKKFKLITTEVVPLEKFYKAEIYHQNYEENHPENAYVQRVSLPRINKFKAKFSQLLKQR